MDKLAIDPRTLMHGGSSGELPRHLALPSRRFHPRRGAVGHRGHLGTADCGSALGLTAAVCRAVKSARCSRGLEGSSVF